jgi:hypothetical protein
MLLNRSVINDPVPSRDLTLHLGGDGGGTLGIRGGDRRGLLRRPWLRTRTSTGLGRLGLHNIDAALKIRTVLNNDAGRFDIADRW